MASVWVASACQLGSTAGSASSHDEFTNAQASMRQVASMFMKTDHCAILLILFVQACTVFLVV